MTSLYYQVPKRKETQDRQTVKKKAKLSTEKQANEE